jgi:hypothetical protein
MGRSININSLESVIKNLKLAFPNPSLEGGYPQKSSIVGVYLILCLCVWLNITDSVLEFIVSDNKVTMKSKF